MSRNSNHLYARKTQHCIWRYEVTWISKPPYRCNEIPKRARRSKGFELYLFFSRRYDLFAPRVCHEVTYSIRLKFSRRCGCKHAEEIKHASGKEITGTSFTWVLKTHRKGTWSKRPPSWRPPRPRWLGCDRRPPLDHSSLLRILNMVILRRDLGTWYGYLGGHHSGGTYNKRSMVDKYLRRDLKFPGRSWSMINSTNAWYPTIWYIYIYTHFKLV